MKKVLKLLGYSVLVIIFTAASFAGYVAISGIPTYTPGKVNLKIDVTPVKVERGRKYASMLCITCHLDPSTGKLTGKRLADVPPSFGVSYSKNITRDPIYGVGAWTNGEIAYLLRTGITRTGRYAPPWMPKFPHMSDEDLGSVISFLRSDDPLTAPAAVNPPGISKPSFLTKLLTHVVFKPLPYPTAPILTPAATDQVAYGRYLSVNLGCFACHSANFRSNNELEPEKSAGYMGGGNPLQDESGQLVLSANLTPDPSGLAQWNESDFTRALRTGIRPDHTVLSYPMSPAPELTNADAHAIYAYLRTVPKIHNVVARTERPAVAAGTNQGKTLYYHYGCNSCHGDSGSGVGDLRHATQDYPTDPQLEAFIRHASSFKPGTKMPEWNGIIGESEYTPLIGYIRELGRTAASSESSQ
ncbi:MAG: c-type cytochrome [Acidobacteria bacterium]|nr:c-type cytochrome [Acidobacteriota bacterium]